MGKPQPQASAYAMDTRSWTKSYRALQHLFARCITGFFFLGDRIVRSLSKAGCSVEGEPSVPKTVGDDGHCLDEPQLPLGIDHTATRQDRVTAASRAH